MQVVAARPTEAETSFAYAALGDLLGSHPRGARRAPRPAAPRARGRPPRGGARRGARPAGRRARHPRRRCARSPVRRRSCSRSTTCSGSTGSSAAVLGFAARRLADEPIALLLAQRTAGAAPAPLDLDRAPAGDRLDRLVAGPAQPRRRPAHPAAPARLDPVPPGAPPRARALGREPVLRARARAGGAGGLAAPAARRAAPGHARGARRTPGCDGLSTRARRGLAVAASMRQPTLAVVNAVAGDDALAEAEDAQIVHVRDGVVRFAHPLLASGAYAATDPATRRALHAAIAERVSEPEERARHLALAATGPDEAVAGALDDAGRRAQSRGAPAAAADLFERAAQLTPAGSGRRRQAPDHRRRRLRVPVGRQPPGARAARRGAPHDRARPGSCPRARAPRAGPRLRRRPARRGGAPARGDRERRRRCGADGRGALPPGRDALPAAGAAARGRRARQGRRRVSAGRDRKPRRSAPGCCPRRRSAIRERRRRFSGCWSSTPAAVIAA